MNFEQKIKAQFLQLKKKKQKEKKDPWVCVF